MSDGASGPAQLPIGNGQMKAPRELPEEVARRLQQDGYSLDAIELLEMQVRSHEGPLPAVETFAGYDKVCPGAARAILDMALAQQAHAHEMERYLARCEFRLPLVAIFVAALIIVSMLGSGVYLAMNNHEGLAIGVFSGTGMATVAGAFLQRPRRKEAAPTENASAKKKGGPSPASNSQKTAKAAKRSASNHR